MQRDKYPKDVLDAIGKSLSTVTYMKRVGGEKIDFDFFKPRYPNFCYRY